jgi:hypothetical protein
MEPGLAEHPSYCNPAINAALASVLDAAGTTTAGLEEPAAGGVTDDNQELHRLLDTTMARMLTGEVTSALHAEVHLQESCLLSSEGLHQY